MPTEREFGSGKKLKKFKNIPLPERAGESFRRGYGL
jgi:hypothetical protein